MSRIMVTDEEVREAQEKAERASEALYQAQLDFDGAVRDYQFLLSLPRKATKESEKP